MTDRVVCRYCGSEAVVKYGLFEGIQRYWCKACERKFRANDNPFLMKTSAAQVSSALSMFFQGESINAIRENLQQQYDNYPSSQTVFAWLGKYTGIAARQFENDHPLVGNTWAAEETLTRVKGQNWWVMNILDTDTRYLLAEKLSYDRGVKDISELLKEAGCRAQKTPGMLYTGGCEVYNEVLENAFFTDSGPVKVSLHDNQSAAIVEHYHGVFEGRYRTLRGFKSPDSANRFLQGFAVFYNYLRPHEHLGGQTPAERAGVKYDCRMWADIVLKADSYGHKASADETEQPQAKSSEQPVD